MLTNFMVGGVELAIWAMELAGQALNISHIHGLPESWEIAMG
jgi:hypothetical protein